MFSPHEHSALQRLMRYALGCTQDSKLIAKWLVNWEAAEDIDDVPRYVEGLAMSHQDDIQAVAEAANRDIVRPTELGRLEYQYNMVNVRNALNRAY